MIRPRFEPRAPRSKKSRPRAWPSVLMGLGAMILAGCSEMPTSPSQAEASGGLIAPSMSPDDHVDRQPLVVEFAGASDFTTATAVGDQLGWSQLRRDGDGLGAVVHAEGLEPGGVFTFWWVVVQDDATFPDDIFVALGAGAVVGQNGKATAFMSAETGDASIVGLPALGGALFGDLTDPEGALVRVEVAYHGPVDEAGDDLDQWLTDFWTGSACPTEGVNAAGQPHCPVYFAGTHAPN